VTRYAKPLSDTFLKNIQQPSHHHKQNANDGVNKNMENEEEKYVDDTIGTSMPLAFSALLFSFFFMLSSVFYCALFLWRNPLDGLFFTGMLFTTTEDAYTVSKVRLTFIVVFIFLGSFYLGILRIFWFMLHGVFLSNVFLLQSTCMRI